MALFVGYLIFIFLLDEFYFFDINSFKSTIIYLSVSLITEVINPLSSFAEEMKYLL
jgi:hypothetical protein